MEKRKPHHDLGAFKKQFSTLDGARVTRSALKGAQALGFTLAMMMDAIQSMRPGQFYKSMTSMADHQKWQDVYHVPWGDVVLYVKFTDERITEFVLLSFKEK